MDTAKFVVSQILGGGAGYVTYAMFQELYGNVPFYIPVGAWLIVSLVVLFKL